MGIFSKKQQIAVDNEERSLFTGYLPFGGFTYMGKAMNLDAVYAAVNQISNSVAQLPICIYKIDGERKIKLTNNQLAQLLNYSPDGVHNHFSFMKIVIESLILRGNAYILIDRDEQLNTTKLKYVDSDFVQPIVQPDGSVKYIVDGLDRAVDSNNIIHLYQHVDNTGRGISVLKYAYNSLKGVAAAEEQASNFFESGQNVSGIIKASATLNKEQKDQIRASWNSAFNTQNNKTAVAILPSGLDYTPISVNPGDAQLLESREFNVLTVARWFNIPPVKLFHMDGSTYNGQEFAQVSYLQDCIGPYIKLLEEEFNRKIFKPSQVGKIVIGFDFTALLNCDKKTEAEYFRSLINTGLISINEARAKLGYEPIPDGEAGNKHWIQISMAPIDSIANGEYNQKVSQSQNQKTDNNAK